RGQERVVVVHPDDLDERCRQPEPYDDLRHVLRDRGQAIVDAGLVDRAGGQTVVDIIGADVDGDELDPQRMRPDEVNGRIQLVVLGVRADATADQGGTRLART